MKHVLVVALATILATVSAGTTAAPPAERGAERARVYVAYHADRRGPAQQALAAVGAEVHYDFPGLRAFAVSLPAVAVEALARNPAIEYVEADPKRYPAGQVVPYGIPMVQADQVAEGGAVGATMVCIIDSGLDLGHEDFASSQFSGTDDPGTGNWFTDENSHGTHVAGTIAAFGNDKGVVGVAADGSLPIHIIKVFGEDAWAYSSGLTAALQACETAAGSRNLVVNMSLGGSFKSRTEERAFAQAYNRGVLSIAAAGNGGNTRHHYPASYNSVISVAAIDENKVVAPFSQQTSQVELAGPGVAVLSTVPMGTAAVATVAAGSNDYAAEGMDGTPNGTATGTIVDCGLGTSVCNGSNHVCLISRGTNSFADKVLNCQTGGGKAAVIYNNQPGALFGTLGGTVTTIPSVGITQADGAAILALGAVSGTVAVGPGNYARYDGTSMATPHVAGVAAVVWSHDANWSNQQIRDTLAATAEDLGPGGRDNAYGFGLVQAAAALTSLSGGGGGEPPPPPPPPEGFVLSATGYKVKGVQHADLSWSGATSTNVDILRTGEKVTTTANDGAYTDNIGNRGGGSYTYRVCEAGTSTCSNEATVTF